ncbi:MAG: PIN domain-containing protein [Acidobacteria bacterium]|nr:PIN domain-containing protein [Acidobacteriota bacterium]
MNGDRLYFVDTNVLLYACAQVERDKAEVARRWLDVLWKQGTGRLSWQVLHEFYVNAVRKMAVPREDAQARVELLIAWSPIDTTAGLVRRAWEWSDSAALSYWDALIVAAAERQGCQYLLTEDMQADRKFGDVLVVNPFAMRAEPSRRRGAH